MQVVRHGQSCQGFRCEPDQAPAFNRRQSRPRASVAVHGLRVTVFTRCARERARSDSSDASFPSPVNDHCGASGRAASLIACVSPCPRAVAGKPTLEADLRSASGSPSAAYRARCTPLYHRQRSPGALILQLNGSSSLIRSQIRSHFRAQRMFLAGFSRFVRVSTLSACALRVAPRCAIAALPYSRRRARYTMSALQAQCGQLRNFGADLAGSRTWRCQSRPQLSPSCTSRRWSGSASSTSARWRCARPFCASLQPTAISASNTSGRV